MTFLEKKEEKSVPSESKFKDLSSVNKKKRANLKKPWGRAERIGVLLFLALTVGVGIYFAVSTNNKNSLNALKIKTPSFPITKEKVVVVDSSETKINEKEKAKQEDVVEIFNQLTSNLSGKYSFYLLRLKDSTAYGVNENDILTAASFSKLPLMVALVQQFESNNLNPKTLYTLSDSDKIGGSGSLYYSPAGTQISYGDILTYLGKQSDNTAYKIARNILGDELIGNVVNQVGMPNTQVFDDQTTSRDIGQLFKLLWNGKLLSKDNSNMVLDSLTDTIYEDYLPFSLPKEVKVAHKYGREDGVINDGGIVYGNEPFVLVIMSEGINDTEATTFFQTFPKQVYDIESKTN